MTTQQLIGDFVAKWGPGGSAFALNEERGAQQHFAVEGPNRTPRL